MISFLKTIEDNIFVFYVFQTFSPGKLKINKKTQEIIIIESSDEEDEDIEELKYVVHEFIIQQGYPERYIYAWA